MKRNARSSRGQGAAMLLNCAEENWSAFERWLQSMGYTYTEKELDEAAVAIRERAGQA